MADRYALWANRVAARYENEISGILGFDLPYNVSFKSYSGPEFAQVYQANGGKGTATAFWDYESRTIVINRARANMNDPGMVVHELVHAYQGVSSKGSKFTEGLSDFVRWKLGLTTPGWTLSPAAARFADMTPQEIRRAAARQSSVDGTEDPTGDTNEPRSGDMASRVREQIKRTTNNLMQDVEPGMDVSQAQIKRTLLATFKELRQNGKSVNDILQTFRHLAVSRSGDAIFYTGGDGAAGLGDLIPILPAQGGRGDGGGGDGGGIDTSDGISEEEALALAGFGTDALAAEAPSRREYLAGLSGIPITAEIRKILEQALKEKWSTAEFNFEVQKSDTFFRDQSITYRGMLQDFGISGGNLDNLMHKAVRGGYSEGEFLYFLRKTPEYRQRFRGIFKADGTMRMTEGEWLQFEFGLQTLGKQYGYKVDAQDIGESLRKGITLESFEDRLSALQRVREYEPAIKAFQQTLKARGMLPKGFKDWDKKDMYEFVTGQKDQKFYHLWEEASARTAAFQAGIDILDKGEGKKEPGGVGYTDIRRGALMKIIKGLPGYQTEEQLAEGFQQLGDSLLEVLPLSEARSFGLTKQDLIKATFGGKNAAKARQRVKRVIETHEAFQEDRANTRFGVDESGRAGIEQGRGVGQQAEY